MLVEADQVLDLGPLVGDGGGTETSYQGVRTMFDPGALGNLFIGLEGIRREQELYERGVPRVARPHRYHRGMRHGVAAILRRTAAFIEPAALPAG
jgi:hypothetical protein